MSDKTYDVVIIGAGPAGYVGAIRAAQLGLKTAIIDKEWLGGVCLNVGCIPSKALLKNAEVIYTLRKRGKEFGFSVKDLTFDYSVAVKRSRRVSNQLTKGVGFLMKKNHVDVVMGTARVASPQEVVVQTKKGEISLKTRNIVIATGAHPAMIPGVEPDGERILTYREAILQETLPKSAIIIGGGPIGVEFATIWNGYGVPVTVVEMLPTLLPLEDPEIGKELAKAFTKQGIKVLTGTKVEGITADENGVKVSVTGKKGAQVLEADQVLVAIGFKPNTTGLGLEELGIRLTPKGAIEVDDRMATNVPGIWATGDVTGKLMLAHVGFAQGIVCSENIAGVETVKLDYEMMPRAVYTNPQVATFGLTEAKAKERGYNVKVARFPFQANGKALGLGERAGWAKLVVNADDGEILGAQLVGPEVSELLPELTLAQLMEITPEEIARNVHAHPTLSEVLVEAAHVATGNPIHI